MSRWCMVLLMAGAAFARQAPDSNKTPPKQDAAAQEVQLPPEEDITAPKAEQFSFNPVKSKRDVSVGEYYFKKGDFKAAANRFLEATKWNDGNAEAWLRLGETAEKQQNTK